MSRWAAGRPGNDNENCIEQLRPERLPSFRILLRNVRMHRRNAGSVQPDACGIPPRIGGRLRRNVHRYVTLRPSLWP